MKDLPVRKKIRLQDYDYSQAGCYFITICVKDRHELLGRIVRDGVLDMPNHIHMLLSISGNAGKENGTSRTPSPTNAIIPAIISTLKRFVHKDCGFAFFQRSYHDHIIRSETEYQKIWQYIDENPATWPEDCYYTK